MVWYKSWLETRWRFVIGLVLLVGSAATVVLGYPQVMKLLPLASAVEVGGPLGNRIKEAIELSRDYRGYVWSQWFRQNMMQTLTLFAVLLGTGGLLAQTSGGAALFTLSLPVSRTRLLGTRAATGLLELLALAMVPSLHIALISPVVGQSYSPVDALVHGLCVFVGGSAFFSLAFLLSTVFADVWRPALIALCACALAVVANQVFPALAPFNPIHTMTAESYFRTGQLPWAGLFVSAAASGALLYAAILNIARRDF